MTKKFIKLNKLRYQRLVVLCQERDDLNNAVNRHIKNYGSLPAALYIKLQSKNSQISVLKSKMQFENDALV